MRVFLLATIFLAFSLPAMAEFNNVSTSEGDITTIGGSVEGVGVSTSDGNASFSVDQSIHKNKGGGAAFVDAPGLAGLASSDCVLSVTDSGGASVGVSGVGVGVTYGHGETTPYDECNEREAIKVVAQINGPIDGVDSNLIVTEMVRHLTGVQAAIDRVNGKQVSQAPVAPAKEQVASLPTPKVFYGSNR